MPFEVFIPNMRKQLRRMVVQAVSWSCVIEFVNVVPVAKQCYYHCLIQDYPHLLSVKDLFFNFKILFIVTQSLYAQLYHSRLWEPIRTVYSLAFMAVGRVGGGGGGGTTRGKLRQCDWGLRRHQEAWEHLRSCNVCARRRQYYDELNKNLV